MRERLLKVDAMLNPTEFVNTNKHTERQRETHTDRERHTHTHTRTHLQAMPFLYPVLAGLTLSAAVWHS